MTDRLSLPSSHPRVRRLAAAWAQLCLLLLPLLSGCAKPTLPPGTTQITFAFLDRDVRYYEALAAQFSASHPTIAIDLLPMAVDKLLYSRRAGESDVIATTETAARALWQRGGIVSLNRWLERDSSVSPSDFYPDTVGALTSAGETWAVPIGMDVFMMYYNQDLFDEQELAYPEIGWTWDDFVSRALVLRDPESFTFGYAFRGSGSVGPVAVIYQHGGQILDDWNSPSRATFDDPLTIEALDWWASLIHEHDVAPTPKQARDDFGRRYSIHTGIQAGMIAMWGGWFSERGGTGWYQEWPFQWGMVTLPQDAQCATVVDVWGYAISSQAEQPDVCWEWIAFLSNQAPPRVAPARRSMVESEPFAKEVGVDAVAALQASMVGTLLVWHAYDEPEDTWELFSRAIDRIHSGKSTPQEAMTDAQQEAEK